MIEKIYIQSSFDKYSAIRTSIPKFMILDGLGRGNYATEDISKEFKKYWNIEQDKAFLKLVSDENLSKERTKALVEHYIYAEKEPMRDEILDLLEGDKPTLLQRRPIGDRILQKIVDFVETFVNGVAGA